MRNLVYILTLFALYGCVVPLPADRLGTKENYIHDRNNLFCANSLDRTGLGARVGEDDIASPFEVLAGYDNILYPGADPFPCNTSHSTLFTGGIHFSAPQELIERVNRSGGVLGASVVLERRSTGVPIVAQDTSPSPRGNNQCQFVLTAPTKDWNEGYERTGSIINFGGSVGVISGGEEVVGTFTNSDSVAGPIRVTSSRLRQLVRAWARGTIPNLGLEIRPNPSNPEVYRGLSNATCLGVFYDPILEVIVPRHLR